MKLLSKLTLAPALLLAASSAYALNIDPDAGGPLQAGDFYFGANTAFLNDNVLCQGCIPTGTISTGDTVTGTLFAQAAHPFSTEGNNDPEMALTFELTVPVTIEFEVIGGGTPRLGLSMSLIDPTNDSTFRLYLQNKFRSDWQALTPVSSDISQNLGTGYDDIFLASGHVTKATTGPATELKTAQTPGPLDSNAIGGDSDGGATTVDVAGSSAFEVKITSQDNTYVKSDLIGAFLDLVIGELSLNAPFSTAEVADLVVGNTPDLGDDNIQNGVCNRAKGDDTPCDLQLTGGPDISFNDARIPEPTTLALLGLGLVAAGGIRRRKSAS